MDWQTREEIQKAAETSLLAAVRCSKKHWWQLTTATEKELRVAERVGLVGLGTIWCALCARYPTCRSCMLNHSGGCAWPLHDAAVSMLFAWRKRKKPHSDFTKAARKLHKRLCAEERKLLAKKAG